MLTPKTHQILALLHKDGILRSRDLERAGIHRSNLRTLVASGKVVRTARGLYHLSNLPVTENHSLLEVAKQAPHGVFCLHTALVFHQITTQTTPDIWIAIKGSSWKPKIPGVRTRFHRFTGKAFREGIEEHQVEGGKIRVYSVAKTVADCFKMRNKVGLDVAMEAMREAIRSGKTSWDEIHRMAKVCRVDRVVRPYMDMEAFS